MKPEDSLHITIADWLRVKYPDLLWWHVPNGWFGNKRSPIQGAKLKRMGVLPGVPDIVIPFPQKMKFVVTAEQIKGFEEIWKKDIKANVYFQLLLNHVPDHPHPIFRRGYNGFFSELKAGKNKPTTAQKDTLQKLTELGYYCCVCYSLDEFIKEWETYYAQ